MGALFDLLLGLRQKAAGFGVHENRVACLRLGAWVCGSGFGGVQGLGSRVLGAGARIKAIVT